MVECTDPLDRRFAVLGLVLDKKLGNLLKCSFFLLSFFMFSVDLNRRVAHGFHGSKQLGSKLLRTLYGKGALGLLCASKSLVTFT